MLSTSPQCRPAQRPQAPCQKEGIVASYLTIRQSLGYIGLALPVVLLVGGLAGNEGIAPSISHFYYTSMQDVFVGALCAIGVFLMGSWGPDSHDAGFITHKRVSRIGGVGAIGLALVPTHTDKPFECSFVQCMTGMQTGSDIHHVFAGLFFLSMALFCLFLFYEREEDGTGDHARMALRNRIYKGSGAVILVAMAALYTYRISSPETKAVMDANSYQFWIESIGVWAFGLCWLIKGHAFSALNDRDLPPQAVNLDCEPSRPKISLAYARALPKLPHAIPVRAPVPALRKPAHRRA
ncbi:hypothetical protein PSA7680_02223 [Pseudoruegeria aquimaris]|uniref:Frag1/DRAM/Sfk1 family protein n=1 Tax=Pseudoruegeria aquimaris TaxID=393663 RepID=A0A1Y5SN19_9RHOB|nr:hypothetical protein [Pseudoruegeria aquimaris]SLN43866.1 hypothetical protein PSA7680_02223 [Pseudoruegeria aquimaris]